MSRTVVISQPGGLTLMLSPDERRPGVLFLSLTGTDFHTRVSVDNAPAFPGLGHLHEFLTAAANGQSLEWTALGEDVRFASEPLADQAILLRVYMASTSDDACDWLVNATLEVFMGELRLAAEAMTRLFQESQ